VTEIPEHLLKRSKERRAALGLPGGESGDAGSGATDAGDPSAAGAAGPSAAVEQAAPVVPARPAAPTPAPPPPPLPAYVQAANRRRRIPYWAMPIVALLPIWAYLYLGAISPPPASDELAEGQELYSRCSSCHAANGSGGIGAQLNEGEVLRTFKDPQDLMMWLRLGAEGGARPDGTYGDADRPGGAHTLDELPGVMPAFDLDAAELVAVTRYVRETLAGEAEPGPEVDYELIAEEAIAAADAGELPSAGGGGEEEGDGGGGGGGEGEANASPSDSQANEGAGSGSNSGGSDAVGQDEPEEDGGG